VTPGQPRDAAHGLISQTSRDLRRLGTSPIFLTLLAVVPLILALTGCGGSKKVVLPPTAGRLLPIVHEVLPPIKVTTTPNGISVITLPSDYFFAFDSSTVSSIGITALTQVALILKSSNGPIYVSGYTDGIGTPQYNLALSRRRANAVRVWLIHGGLAATRIHAVGKGEAAPQGRADPSARKVVITFTKH
jgi:outer membrane protein OmpA-like peptidoglycan-associated protein